MREKIYHRRHFAVNGEPVPSPAHEVDRFPLFLRDLDEKRQCHAGVDAATFAHFSGSFPVRRP
jgi:hypothetical protein